jgi:hypothetical protein
MKRVGTHEDLWHPSSWCWQLKLPKTRWSILAVNDVLKRLYLSVLRHIKISQNKLELTEIWGSRTPPPGDGNLRTLQKLDHAAVDFGG